MDPIDYLNKLFMSPEQIEFLAGVFEDRVRNFPEDPDVTAEAAIAWLLRENARVAGNRGEGAHE